MGDNPFPEVWSGEKGLFMQDTKICILAYVLQRNQNANVCQRPQCQSRHYADALSLRVIR